MKKSIYTLAFVALFSLAGTAQSADNKAVKQESGQKSKVNPDGTLAEQGGQQDQKRAQQKDQGAKDMSVSDKQPPASKNKEKSNKEQPK